MAVRDPVVLVHSESSIKLVDRGTGSFAPGRGAISSDAGLGALHHVWLPLPRVLSVGNILLAMVAPDAASRAPTLKFVDLYVDQGCVRKFEKHSL